MGYWIPACAGMTAGGAAVTWEYRLRENCGFVDHARLRHWIPACAGMTAGGAVAGVDPRLRGNSVAAGRARHAGL